MTRSDINYLDYTWNPIKRKGGGYACTKVSEGCAHCWSSDYNRRFHKHGFDAMPIDFVLDEKELLAPLKIKKPSIIGVQFMSDLFHKDVWGQHLLSVFVVMTGDKLKHHQWLILTKRPDRMRDWIGDVVHIP
ncbi:MAG: DUF5131 family protein, partial [bacterium]